MFMSVYLVAHVYLENKAFQKVESVNIHENNIIFLK